MSIYDLSKEALPARIYSEDFGSTINKMVENLGEIEKVSETVYELLNDLANYFVNDVIYEAEMEEMAELIHKIRNMVF